jgi:hypothetical protein
MAFNYGVAGRSLARLLISIGLTIFEGNRGWMRSIYLSGHHQRYYYFTA